MSVLLQRVGLLDTVAPAGGFTPADLFASGEAGDYWEADDKSTLWTDFDKTTQVTTDGDVVGAWDGKSGNGHAFKQATTSLKPLYKESGGISWISPDGIDDRLFEDLMDPANTETWTFWMAEDNDGDAQWIHLHGGTTPWLLAVSDGSGSSAINDSSVTQDNLWIEGALETPSTRDDLHTLLNGTKTLIQEFTLSASFSQLNLFNFGSFEFGGKVHAFGLVRRSLTAGEVSDLDAYMKGKQGR